MTAFIQALLVLLFALGAAPLVPGLIVKTKAWFAGRTGAPVLQLYYDLFKLLRKGSVYSVTTTLVFRLAPVIILSATLLALALLPFGGNPALLHFSGDFILLLYLLGLARFFLVVAALDTGSAFEGMGASREVLFSALAEPAVLLTMSALASHTGLLDLSEISARLTFAFWEPMVPALVLLAATLFIVALAENARIPVDDPNTHLELTMIHEVMILDHGGPDLGLLLYASALKLWLMIVWLLDVALPFRSSSFIINLVVMSAGVCLVAVLVGIVESCMARLRLLRVPQLLVGASVLAAVALVLMQKGGGG